MRYNLITRNALHPFAQLMKEFEDDFFSPTLSRDNMMLSPRTEWRETDISFLLSFDLPGMDEKDIKIDFKDNQLTVQAERKHSFEKKEGDSFRSEKQYGLYSRTLDLPLNIDESGIEAEYKNGVLEIAVPKSEKAKAKTISIKAKRAQNAEAEKKQ